MLGTQIGILYNPIAGRAKSLAVMNQVQDHLQKVGFLVQAKESQAQYEAQEIEQFLGSVDALLIAGGDGTLRNILFALAKTKTPVYMLPSGNESLFARAFSMSANPKQAEAALRNGRVSQHYIAQVNGEAFFTMASVGLDSEVIARIARTRSGPIGHVGYLLPTCQAILSHVAPRIDLVVDGEKKLQGESGLLIIANSPEYAGNLNPVPEADNSDQRLHARFYPYRRLWVYGKFLMSFVLKRGVSVAGSTLFVGNTFQVTISNHEAFPIQADGEYVSQAPGEFSITDQQISVIVGLPKHNEK